ncbi:MAG: histidine phosphatase family protein [Nanobdellota archaeon]
MAIVQLLRHSYKNDDGNLSEKGKEAAFEKGKELADHYHGIKIIAYSSQISRAKETGKLIMEGAGLTPENNIYAPFLHFGIDADTKQKIMNVSGDDFLTKSINGAYSWIAEHAVGGALFMDQQSSKKQGVVYVGISHDPIVNAVGLGLFQDKSALNASLKELTGIEFNPSANLITSSYMDKQKTVVDSLGATVDNAYKSGMFHLLEK